MNPDVQKALMDRLDALAAKLGVAADHLWVILVRQARIEGWGAVIFALLALGLVLISFYWLRWGLVNGPKNLSERYDEWKWQYLLASILGTVGTLVGVIACLCNSYTAFIYLLNPEYAALRKLAELFGK